jgi:hypothetical protein
MIIPGILMIRYDFSYEQAHKWVESLGVQFISFDF